MYQANFGRNGQVSFSCPGEYYRMLGYLAKSDGSTSITWENNEESGAWGKEGRIHFYRRDLPLLGTLKLTAGNGSIIYRVNCNQFVEHISKYHGFVQGKFQDISLIRSTIPSVHLKDFELGLKL